MARTEHYVEMARGPSGRYWTILPKATDEAEGIDYRVATVDAQGAALTREEGHLSVLAACAATVLSPEELKSASNMVIGSDSEGPAMPVGFRCDGVVARVTANELQAYNACAEEALAVAAARRTLILVPPAEKVVLAKGNPASRSLQAEAATVSVSGLPVTPLHHRTPRRAPLPPTPPQPRLSEPVSPARP